VTEPTEPAVEITEWPWLKIARQELGVKESPGSGDNPRVVEYLKSTTLGRPDNENDETPWCSAFVNWVLKQAGVEPRTNSAWARSWLNWGVATDDPIPGTIVVFARGQNAGHVAFYLDEDEDRIQVLGGNQGNAVTIAWFSKANLLGYREPKGWVGV
ncbi:MAG: NlpC/P60 family protein, partial [Desulfobacca sp.]|uniref:NlpC/P60 family protein n=1 Tax=Desulfobacca sp. TaxID=2067990 RepID=UPI00404AE149